MSSRTTGCSSLEIRVIFHVLLLLSSILRRSQLNFAYVFSFAARGFTHTHISQISIRLHTRPQIFYTEEDKPIMEAAWQLTAAHRESLSGHVALPVILDGPGLSVLDLLQRGGGD